MLQSIVICNMIDYPIVNDCKLCNEQIGRADASEIVACGDIFHRHCLKDYITRIDQHPTSVGVQPLSSHEGVQKYKCPECTQPFNEIYLVEQIDNSNFQNGTKEGKISTSHKTPKL